MQYGDNIKIFCANYGITLAELARKLNRSPQSLNQKIKRNTFLLSDLEEIAIVTGCKLECNLVLLNGDKIDILK